MKICFCNYHFMLQVKLFAKCGKWSGKFMSRSGKVQEPSFFFSFSFLWQSCNVPSTTKVLFLM